MMKSSDIETLERQGCFCEDWSRVTVADGCDVRKIRNVVFRGDVSVGANVEILNVPGGIANVRIGNDVRIINVSRIECTPDASFGIGQDIDVLDETGSRPVRIYPGISSQVATLSTRIPEYASGRLFSMIDEHISQMPDMPEIGDGAEIVDCGAIIDVRIWPGVKVEGALKLRNGSIVNNSSNGNPLTYVGYGVDAENFIIEDGVVDGGCQLRNVYVGQGVVLDKHFTAHDSLFFANCSMENGEACAVLAGPFTVSMHKSSLLIGMQSSFLNAGSGTNMSNHDYKLGPVHWGVFERGVKMASNAYVMHGARIGSYSLVMGSHKSNPDSSMFPFSYLFGDERGTTTLIPAAMLKSFGLKRDCEKWPARDRRQGHAIPLHDRITFSVFNPYTKRKIAGALDIIEKLLSDSHGGEESTVITYKKLKISRKHLREARNLYKLVLADEVAGAVLSGQDWIDLGAQVIPASTLHDLMNSQSIRELESVLDKAAARYDDAKSDCEFENLSDLLQQDRQAAIDSLPDYPLS